LNIAGFWRSNENNQASERPGCEITGWRGDPIYDGRDQANMIHSTVPPGQINKATVHNPISEFRDILVGEGEIWRKEELETSVISLGPGKAIDIPAGTSFQHRNVGDDNLKFICIAMPPWPGDEEAEYVKGIW
jgi:mannose-6-phosphate isomerase-like protein (cupin superfamily)